MKAGRPDDGGDEFGEQAADLVDGQRDHVRVLGLFGGGGLGGADREDGQGGQGQSGEPVP